jgi:hypothetical protein
MIITRQDCLFTLCRHQARSGQNLALLSRDLLFT